MAKSKGFKGNTAMSFISQESIDKVDGKPAPDPTGKAPEGYKPNPAYIESRTKRVQLLIQPSLYAEAKATSDKLGISVNDFIHRAIKEATYNDYVLGLITKDVEEKR